MTAWENVTQIDILATRTATSVPPTAIQVIPAATPSADKDKLPLYHYLRATERKEWLTDLHMREVSELMKMANAHIDGLQDPILQINHTWKNPISDFIQIFNKDACHWVTVSSIGMPEGSVAV